MPDLTYAPTKAKKRNPGLKISGFGMSLQPLRKKMQIKSYLNFQQQPISLEDFAAGCDCRCESILDLCRIFLSGGVFDTSMFVDARRNLGSCGLQRTNQGRPTCPNAIGESGPGGLGLRV